MSFDLKSRIEIQAFHPQGVQPQIPADQLTLSQPRGADYAHHMTTGTPRFSNLPTALCTYIAQHQIILLIALI